LSGSYTAPKAREPAPARAFCFCGTLLGDVFGADPIFFFKTAVTRLENIRSWGRFRDSQGHRTTTGLSGREYRRTCGDYGDKTSIVVGDRAMCAAAGQASRAPAVTASPLGRARLSHSTQSAQAPPCRAVWIFANRAAESGAPFSARFLRAPAGEHTRSRRPVAPGGQRRPLTRGSVGRIL